MKQKKPMRRISRNKVAVNRIYIKRAKEYVEENPVCKIRSPVCSGRTQCPHHARGRLAERLLNENEWFPSCFKCNGYLEDNKQWGKDRGFRLDRIGIVK